MSVGTLNQTTKGLQQHFQEVDPDQQTGVWDQVWQKKVTPWDRATPSPALIDTLNDKTSILGSPFRQSGSSSQRRKKAFVPGCGRGYDVLLFASYGYDAWGLDASQTAVDAARELQQEQGEDESKYPLRTSVDGGGRGEVKFVFGDFFKDDVLAGSSSSSSEEEDHRFDVIYDYTFLCALPPHLRPRWAKRMAELLKPTGHLICLEFPLHKDPQLGGPPHGLSSELYEQLFARPGEEVSYDEGGKAREAQSRELAGDALVRVAHWAPERTHEVGSGTDRVSIWRPGDR